MALIIALQKQNNQSEVELSRLLNAGQDEVRAALRTAIDNSYVAESETVVGKRFKFTSAGQAAVQTWLDWQSRERGERLALSDEYRKSEFHASAMAKSQFERRDLRFRPWQGGALVLLALAGILVRCGGGETTDTSTVPTTTTATTTVPIATTSPGSADSTAAPSSAVGTTAAVGTTTTTSSTTTTSTTQPPAAAGAESGFVRAEPAGPMVEEDFSLAANEVRSVQATGVAGISTEAYAVVVMISAPASPSSVGGTITVGPALDADSIGHSTLNLSPDRPTTNVAIVELDVLGRFDVFSQFAIGELGIYSVAYLTDTANVSFERAPARLWNRQPVLGRVELDLAAPERTATSDDCADSFVGEATPPPDGAVGAILNLTADGSGAVAGDSYVQVWAADRESGQGSSLNPIAGVPSANLVFTLFGTENSRPAVALASPISMQCLVVDLAGWVLAPSDPPAPGELVLVDPSTLDFGRRERPFDSRADLAAPLEPGAAPVRIDVSAQLGDPGSARLALLNVTVIGTPWTAAPTNATVAVSAYTNGAGIPTDRFSMFWQPANPPNEDRRTWEATVTTQLVVTEVSSDGAIQLEVRGAPAHVAIDVVAWVAR